MTDISSAIQDNSLLTFVNAFNYSLITVSIQPDKEGGFISPGKYFSPQNRIRAVSNEVFNSDEFQLELQQANNQNCGIFFTINEGDGVPSDLEKNNLNCGKRANIRTLRTLAIDTDDGDAEALMAELKKLHLIPHLVVRSSELKYHMYFLLKPVTTTQENVIKWQALQKKLASLVPKLDQSMADINQILRLPTFYNKKREKPELVRIVNKSGLSQELQDLDFLYDRLEAHEFNDYTKITYGDSPASLKNGLHTTSPNGLQFKSTYAPFEFPKAKLEAGERRQAITRYIEHIMENVLPLEAKDEDYFVLIDAFIIKYLKPQHVNEFLPGGARRQNIEQYFNDQRNYRLKKQQALQSQAAIKEHDHLTAVEENRLPDSFYLNFPGDLGMLTKAIHQYAPKMSLELAFAGALAISGALKADSFRYQGAWPLVNGLIIAGTGAGKSVLKSVIEEILLAANYSGGPFSQLIDFQNTVQSLHTQLYGAGGVGTCLVDESGDYLQVLTAKHAPGYVKALKKYFKEATTGRGKGTRLSPGGSLSFQIPAIAYGMLSLWIFIQPGKFEDSLTIDDMGDGFLPRFFIFNGESNIDLTSTYGDAALTETFEPSLDLKVWAQSFIPKNRASTLTVIEEAEKLAREVNKKIKIQDIRAIQREAVYQSRSEHRLMSSKVQVTLSEDAKGAVLAYLKERNIAAKALQKSNSEDPSLGIYIRMEEMLNRLLCCACDSKGVISLELAEYCIRFHRFQTDRFFRNELRELSKGEQQKDQEKVLHGLRRAIKKIGGYVTIKQITTEISKKPKNISAIIKELIAQGEVWASERAHIKFKDKKVLVYSIAQSEEVI